MTVASSASSVTQRLPMPRWLFWTLLLVLLVPAGIFIGASYQQLQAVLNDVKAVPTSAALQRLNFPGMVSSDDVIALALEHDVMQHRHQRSTALIVTRTWMRFMSLIFGSLMVTIGAAFVLGRVSGPAAEATASNGDLSASLKSSSPGLFMIAFGLVLIAIPNLSTQRIETNDAPTYYFGPGAGTAGVRALPSDLTEEDNQAIAELIRKFNQPSTAP